MALKIRPRGQIRSVRAITVVLVGQPGIGKCLAPGTEVIKYDGTVVPVENIESGDFLLGPDSEPREVLSTTIGDGPMVEIRPVKGQPWRCNNVHVLTLVHSASGILVDVPVDKWAGWSGYRKARHKIVRSSGVDFGGDAPLFIPPIDPYLLGLLLGDGSLTQGVHITTTDDEVHEAFLQSAYEWGLTVKEYGGEERSPTLRMVGPKGQSNPVWEHIKELGLAGTRSADKFVPAGYLTHSRENRLALLAGLMDTDGSLNFGTFDFMSKSSQLAADVAFLARSVGLSATERIKTVEYNGEDRTYHRVLISGHVDIIPTRIPRKQAEPRRQRNNVLHTGFTVEPIEDGTYYGFELDGDGRFLLGDFTITHNTTMANTAKNPVNLDFDEGSHRSLNCPEVVDIYSWKDVSDIEVADLKPFSTVVVDTVGTAIEYLSQDIKPGGNLSIRDYSTLGSRFSSFLFELRSAGINVVLIAHGKEQQSGDEIKLRLDAKGSSKELICAKADLMGRVISRNNQRFVNWDPADDGFGKNPAGLPAERIPNIRANSRYLEDCIRTTIDHLNRAQEMTVEEEKRIANLQKTIETLAGPAEFSALARKMIDTNAAKADRGALAEIAKQRGYVFDRDTITFSDPASPGDEVQREQVDDGPAATQEESPAEQKEAEGQEAQPTREAPTEGEDKLQPDPREQAEKDGSDNAAEETSRQAAAAREKPESPDMFAQTGT